MFLQEWQYLNLIIYGTSQNLELDWINYLNKYLLIEPIWILGFGTGYGVFAWPDGSQYEGNWANGKQHSKGLFINDKEENKKGSGKMESKMNKALQNSKSRFLYFLNGLENEANENLAKDCFPVRILENCLSNCMRWWIKRKHIKKLLLGSNLKGDLLFLFLFLILIISYWLQCQPFYLSILWSYS